MIDDVTFSGNTANSWTGISALVIEAGAVLGTVAIEYTFWTAFSVRIATVIGQTRAGADAVAFLANSVGTTRTGIAGFRNFRRHNN